MPGFVHLTLEEGRKMARFFKMPFNDFKKKYIKYVLWGGHVLNMSVKGGCIFLKGGKCEIYPVRPEQCRTFPYWEDIIADEREWKYVQSYCKGAQNIKILK